MHDNEIRIYRSPIPHTSRIDRRETERMISNVLCVKAFGDTARISHRPDGSPYIASHPQVHISLSHCQDECVLAVSSRPVGIDIEIQREQLLRIALKFLTEHEKSSLTTTDIATLLKYWTAKEAVFKCSGDPTLVISDIQLSDDLLYASAGQKKYELFFHSEGKKTLCIAREKLQAQSCKITFCD